MLFGEYLGFDSTHFDRLVSVTSQIMKGTVQSSTL
jgi:hypothetical protein